MKLYQVLLMIFLAIILIFPSSALALEIQADAALLFDFESGQILFSQNGEKEHVPASLVKIMTMYVALDQISLGRVDLTDTTKVTENPWRMTGSKMFLEPGEVVSIEKLLYGIAVVSGNDACVALAEALAGSEEAYVRWMNDKAKSLGLEMEFVDVHGLSSENKVTAEAVAYLVSSYLTDHPEAIRFHQERTFSYHPRSSRNPIVQPNRNGLLGSFQGADGLKTGHLQAAGYNLVGTAIQGTRRLISVVLGAESELRREQEAIKLFKYGYDNFEIVDISRSLVDQTARVYKGREKQVGLSLNEPLFTIPKGSEKKMTVGIQTKFLEAPVQKGDVVGTLTIFEAGEVQKTMPLVASETIERGRIFRVLWDNIFLFFTNLIKRR